MQISLSNKVAVVNGSSGGIGRAIAIGLAELGSSVIVIARNEEKLKAVLQDLDTSQEQKHFHLVADHTNVEDLIKNLEQLIGDKGLTIEILINNSGGPAAGDLLNEESTKIASAMNQHLICNHRLAQLCVPNMTSKQYGRIINVLSTSVKTPLKNLGVSNTTRAAVASWGKTLSNELGSKGITVNNILPGFTNTGRLQSLFRTWSEKQGLSLEAFTEKMENTVPLNRIGKPEEVANAVCFLASPAASYINGVSLRVDGGRTVSI